MRTADREGKHEPYRSIASDYRADLRIRQIKVGLRSNCTKGSKLVSPKAYIRGGVNIVKKKRKKIPKFEICLKKDAVR